MSRIIDCNFKYAYVVVDLKDVRRHAVDLSLAGSSGISVLQRLYSCQYLEAAASE